MGLTTCCLYGGSPYNAQEIKLRKGVDVVVGTPGRVKVTTNYFNNSHLMHAAFFLNIWTCLLVHQ